MGFPIRRFDANDQQLPLGTPTPPTTNPPARSAPPAPSITLTAPALSSAAEELWPAPPSLMARLTLPPISQDLTEPTHVPPQPSTVSANRHPRRTRTAGSTGSFEGPGEPALTPRNMGRVPVLRRQNQATAGVLGAMVEEERTEPELERSVESDSNAE